MRVALCGFRIGNLIEKRKAILGQCFTGEQRLLDRVSCPCATFDRGGV